VTSPHRSPGAATIVMSVSAAIVAGCAVVLTVFILSDRTEPGVPAPVPLTGTVGSQVKVFDATKVEQGVTGVLINDYKLQASNVQCPDNEPVTVGSVFTCTVSVDGAQETVQITVKSADGHYEAGQPQ
jgi:hypothetical protein